MTDQIHHWLLLLLCVIAGLLAGCEEDVAGPDPFAYPYSLWGVLNPLADTQFVRVFPIETRLDPGEPEPLDARFTSVDLDTGTEWVWRDSVFVDSVGVVGHVYYAPFRAAHAHTYRLEITRGDGASSRVEVEIPRRTTLTLGEPDTTQGVRLPAVLQGDPPRLVNSGVEVLVGYAYDIGALGDPILAFLPYFLPVEDVVQLPGTGWRFVVDLNEVYRIVAPEVMGQSDYNYPQFGIRLGYVKFRAVVGNEEWAPPGDVFDLNVLVQPGTLSNVENGFGFVAGGYREERTWTLPFEVVEKTEFLPNR